MASEDRALFETWFAIDRNSIEEQYYMRPIPSIMGDGWSADDTRVRRIQSISKWRQGTFCHVYSDRYLIPQIMDYFPPSQSRTGLNTNRCSVL